MKKVSEELRALQKEAILLKNKNEPKKWTGIIFSKLLQILIPYYEYEENITIGPRELAKFWMIFFLSVVLLIVFLIPVFLIYSLYSILFIPVYKTIVTSSNDTKATFVFGTLIAFISIVLTHLADRKFLKKNSGPKKTV